MRQPFSAMLLLATVLAVPSHRAWAQAEVGYVLYRVASAPVPQGTSRFKSPVALQADATGGIARVAVEYARRSLISETERPCTEEVEFTWRFSQDMYFLLPNETFTITLTARKSGNCGREHYAQPGPGLITSRIVQTFSAQEGRELKPLSWAVAQTDAESRVYTNEGTGSAALRVAAVPTGPGRMYFLVNLHAFSDLEQFSWQLAYLYQAVPPGAQPGQVPIRNDSPANGSPVTASIPRPGERVRGTGGVPTPIAGGTPGAATGTPGAGTVPGTQGPGAGTSGSGAPGVPAGTSGSSAGAPGSPAGAPGGTPGAAPGVTGATPGSGVSGGGAPAPGASRRTLLAERRTVETGQAVTVPARLLEPAGVANVNFEVTYDSRVVRVDRVARGSLLGATTLLEENSREPGRIRIGFAGQAGLTASGIVANLTLRAVGQPGSRTPLTLKVTEIDDPSGRDLPVELVHGEVVIAGPGGRVPGDCDGDGQMTAADALCALKMSVGLLPVDLVLDANNDRQVTSGDARTILQRIP